MVNRCRIARQQGSIHVATTNSTAADGAKQAILDYCLRKGALAAGVADLALQRIAPPGHRPSDLMPKVKSVISLGVACARGLWRRASPI